MRNYTNRKLIKSVRPDPVYAYPRLPAWQATTDLLTRPVEALAKSGGRPVRPELRDEHIKIIIWNTPRIVRCARSFGANGGRGFLLCIKSNKGFSFIEIILAIAILGIVLTSLFNLENGIFSLAAREHFKISRLFYIKNLFFDVNANERLDKEKSFKTKLTNPSMELSYEMSKPKDKSSLKNFENIYLLKATGNWKDFKNQEETFLTLVYKQPEAKATK